MAYIIIDSVSHFSGLESKLKVFQIIKSLNEVGAY